MPQLPALRLARYRFTAVFERDLELPAFAGSLLRSVFGLALRRGACMTGAPRCEPCPLYRTCAYPAIFACPPRPTQFDQQFSQVPNPYVMEPPPLGTCRLPAGQALAWHQVLIGTDTLRQLPLLAHAWERALRSGWGEQRVRGRLAQLELVDDAGRGEPVLDAGTRRLRPHEPALAWPVKIASASFDAAHLDFETPMRLQHEGRPLRPAELSPRKLVADLLRRCNLMLDLHLGIRPVPFDAPALVAHAAALDDDRSALRWREDTRWSARQRQEVPLGGVLGRWTLRGDLQPLLPWLWLGQWLHVGKNATHGLGGYRLVLEGPGR
ncbi:MAG: CRISPR system precrRNA processing endoribonuclease RAMP protein Cas6 [Burkholderiales bacterium]|nr:CRISPR system precrRNA processing endoribonuclease RAMP protein Cas6 [Burkholderiales bacterium]